MNRFKRILCIFAAALATAALAPCAYAFTDVAADDYCYESILRLSDLGIISGYSDGSFSPQSTITRAEFARIIVSAMNKDTEAKSKGLISSFADVPDGLWSAPYINYVSNQNLVAGYSDGSFQPDKTISFAESLTILLRVLGYNESTVGYFWPNNYVDAGSSLGISSDMPYGVNQPITRGDAAIMLERTLFSDISGQTDKTLLEDTGYTILKDMIVIDSNATNSTMLPGDVRLSDSKVYTSKMSLAASTGQFADYTVLDKNGDIAAMKVTGNGVNKAAAQLCVYVNGINDSTINYTGNGVSGSVRCDSNTVIYINGEKTGFSQAKSQITAGTDMTLYGESYGNWSFMTVSDSASVSPVIAKHNYTAEDTSLEGTPITASGLTIYRDGKSASLSDIRTNDVVYYNTKSNVMDVYSKKVTGIYYSAAPSKAYVETVTIGGNQYTIGSSAAANALNATEGSFEIGERVTLLLGKNDLAVFAVELSETTVEDYGVVLSCGTQIAESGSNEGSSEIYAELFMADGTTNRIVTDRDYESSIGKLVRVTYSGSLAKLTEINGSTSGYGTLDRTNRTLNGKSILKDAKIIQRTAYEKEEYAECVLLDLDTMTADKISSSQLLNIVSANGFGDISLLYVTDVEATSSFGVVNRVVKSSVREGDSISESVSGYRIYSGGTETEYSSSVAYAGIAAGTPIKYTASGGRISSLEKLYQIKSAGTFDAVDSSRVMVNDTIYSLGANVQVIDVTTPTSCSTVSLDSLEEMNNISNITLYSDTSASSAAVIRVITIRTK